MKAHKVANSMDVSHFGAYAVAQIAHPLMHLVQQRPGRRNSSNSVRASARPISIQIRWRTRRDGIEVRQGGHDDCVFVQHIAVAGTMQHRAGRLARRSLRFAYCFFAATMQAPNSSCGPAPASMAIPAPITADGRICPVSGACFNSAPDNSSGLARKPIKFLASIWR